VAQVALTHGLNANLVHKWRRTVDRGSANPRHGTSQAKFIRVALEAIPIEAGQIELELRRGAIAVNATLPMSSPTQCAALLRKILR